MGWTYFHKAPGVKAIEAIKQNCLGAEWCEKHFVTASATFEAVRAILVFKINNVPRARDGYNFGYKDMEEGMGPYGCECAPSIIEAASPLKPLPDVVPEYSSLKSAHEYRARSLAKAKAKAAKRALKVGAKIKLPKPLSFGGMKLDEFVVERCRVRGRKGMSTVFRSVETGGLYSLRADDLTDANITAR